MHMDKVITSYKLTQKIKIMNRKWCREESKKRSCLINSVSIKYVKTRFVFSSKQRMSIGIDVR